MSDTKTAEGTRAMPDTQASTSTSEPGTLAYRMETLAVQAAPEAHTAAAPRSPPQIVRRPFLAAYPSTGAGEPRRRPVCFRNLEPEFDAIDAMHT